MALVTKTSVATGKASATGTWSDAAKPKEGENTFLIVTGGFSVEYNLTVKIVGMEVTSTGVLTGTEVAKLGTAEGGPSGVMLKIASAATVTWTGNVEVSSTFTSSAQTIEVLGHSLKRLTALITSKAKIKLLAALTVTERVTFEVSSTTTSTLELNGQTVTTPILEMREKTTLDATGGGTVKVTGASAGAVFAASAAGVVAVGWGSLTIEAAEAGEAELKKVILPAAVTLGTLVVAERNVEVEGEGATINSLVVNNKGAGAGKGLKFKAAQKFVLGTVSGNGTEAEPARIESSESGTAAKVKVSEQEVTSWVAFQDLTIETGIVYFLHGTSVSGNTTEGTTFKLEAKPAGGVTVSQGMLI